MAVTAEKLATRHGKLVTRLSNLDKRAEKARKIVDNVENERAELEARIALVKAQYASTAGPDAEPLSDEAPAAADADATESDETDAEDEDEDESGF